ncbi:hypothetical protein PIB30_065957 [Stylosanthes scabra]|uniref:GRF-type domain-containing protein n=1 Tax=Stylosanthes scabra TaxID=79078 RepID=A0ABU6SMP1_9FABA|nr:hypothetical protein [Stylosanthes scabra]
MLLCSHGECPVLRVSGTKENPRRRFWGCVRYDVGNLRLHSGVVWADKEQIEEDSERAKLRKKVSTLKTELRACERWLTIAVLVYLGGFCSFACGCRILVEDFIINCYDSRLKVLLL